MKSNLVIELSCKYKQFAISCQVFNTDWQFEMFKRGKPMDMILLSVYFKIGFLYFSNRCCWYTLELPHGGNSNVHKQHMSIRQMSIFSQ